MRCFVFEFVTGGGYLDLSGSPQPPASLFREGTAMLQAVCRDLTSLPDTSVCVLVDRRHAVPILPPGVEPFHVDQSPEFWRRVRSLAGESDHTLIIAPDFDNHLLRCCECVEQVGGKLLSPPSAVVRWAVDKQQTALRLRAAGVPVPPGLVWGRHPTSDVRRLPRLFPALIKPIDGAGGTGVRRIHDPHDLNSADTATTWRLERYCPGQPASVAVLTGVGGPLTLAPCTQRFADARGFEYVGGEIMRDPCLIDRADRLAARVTRVLAGSVGYVGIDMVLGLASDGSEDVVLEINPRLTTSYVGLRAVYRENLTGAMLAVARGEKPLLTRFPHAVEFAADGRVMVE